MSCRKITCKVYRYKPGDPQPEMQKYSVDRDGLYTVLDVMLEIKKIDPTFAFRSACREGACGTCSVNIDGANGLACQTKLGKSQKSLQLYPLPHMKVIRDLVIDTKEMEQQHAEIKPWLQSSEKGEGKFTPEDQAKIDGSWECIMCFSCATSCPMYWWNSDRFLGPANLMQSYRWLQDERDEAKIERLRNLKKGTQTYGCRTILNCVQNCPKNLKPGLAIAEIKKLLWEYRDVLDEEVDESTCDSSKGDDRSDKA